MEKGEIILRLFVPADQESAKAVHPRVCSFYYPKVGFEDSFPFDRPVFFPTGANVSGKVEVVEDGTHLVVVIAFVQTHALRLLFVWCWTFDDDTLNGWTRELHIVAVCSLDCQANRHPMPFSQDAAFYAAL